MIRRMSTVAAKACDADAGPTRGEALWTQIQPLVGEAHLPTTRSRDATLGGCSSRNELLPKEIGGGTHHVTPENRCKILRARETQIVCDGGHSRAWRL